MQNIVIIYCFNFKVPIIIIIVILKTHVIFFHMYGSLEDQRCEVTP